MDAWQTEFDRLRLHRSILANKLTIPTNEATQASLRAHLGRINHQLGKHIHAAMPKPEPFEQALALKAEKKRFGRGWCPDRKVQCRQRLRELRYEQECKDLGITPYKWKPLSDDEFAVCKERLAVIVAKYARVPA